MRGGHASGGRIAVETALVLVLACVGLAGARAAPARAAGEAPWWHVLGTADPSRLTPGGVGEITVVAENLGNAKANGAAAPIVVSDKLPAGIVAIGISGTAGPLSNLGTANECSLETVSCTFAEEIPPYMAVYLEVRVRVEPGARSGGIEEEAAEGAGAARVLNRQPLSVGAGATPFGVEAFEMTPESFGGAPDTQAGSHPFQLTVTLDLNQSRRAGLPATAGGLEKDMRFDLPAGLVGNPLAVPRCTLAEFVTAERSSRNNCPPDTAVGVATITVVVPFLSPLPLTFSLPLFNLVPQTGEPARYGFSVDDDAVMLDTSLRTGGDYGVVVSITNITEEVDVLGAQLTFWGAPDDSRHNGQRGWNCVFFGEGPCPPLQEPSDQPLLTMPTSCATPWDPTVSVDSWAQPSVRETGEYVLHEESGSPLGLTGCNRLTFEPRIIATPDGEDGSTPTGLAVDVHVPQDATLNPTGDAQATVRDTTVTLPAGVALNPAGADGLGSCTTEEVGLESAAPVGCPESAKVGTVEIKTPLLPEPLVGAAYLATQDANPFGALVALYLVAEDAQAGVLVKLAGQVSPDPVSGQLVATFDETPQLPFEDLVIHFFGGSRAPLGTPALCGGYTTSASIVPWSGNPPAVSSSEFKVTSGPNGGACRDPLGFVPTLTAGMTNIQSGAYSPFTFTMSREDGEQSLQSVRLTMPPGLLGTLSNVKLCGEPQADAGTCGAESLIGSTIVSVGLGSDPYSVTGGRVYITGPYDGASYGLSIVNPAQAGPFDLGQVVVRAKIEIDPVTAALTITTDPSGPYAVPHILDGIPLEIKHLNVTIDRPKFMLNPTNCEPLAITGSLGSVEGTTAPVSVPFQVTNCAVLAFKPKLTASTSGRTSRTGGASLTVKLGYPAGPYDANIARVKVELPKQLPSRLPTLQKACPASVFEANPAGCPAASVIGHAVAHTPVIPVSLEGPAYFVSHGGEAWPSLIIVLQGYGATVHLVGSTLISKAGVTSTTFKTIPDVPVGSFELTLPQGRYSALTANTDLCKHPLTMPVQFTGQNGATLDQTTKIAVTGCPKAKASRHRK
jgi:uncharacterized repeat protein (TIGR01451 family)